MIDMHTHSTASDGTYSPEDLLLYAKEKRLKAIALTDHDNINGIKKAIEFSKKINIEFISGIEYSCNFDGRDVHILGYFLNIDDEQFLKRTNNLLKSRDDRNIEIIEKLNKIGFEIRYEDIKNEMNGEIMGRLHIARALLTKKYVKSIKEAFDKYLKNGAKAYVERKNILPHIAVNILKDNGALVSLAHPKLISEDYIYIENLVKDLKNNGLDAIEIYHPSAKRSDKIKFKSLAKKYNLLHTGGSDFHGENKPNIDLGCETISQNEYEKIANYLDKMRRNNE